MTGPELTPNRRSSTNTTIKVVEIVAGSVKSLVVGAMLFGPGLYWFVNEMKDANEPGGKVHIGHISFAVGLMVAGAIAIQPKFGDQITNIYLRVAPDGLPFFGRRSTDKKTEVPRDDA